jgi:hypothetical protein
MRFLGIFLFGILIFITILFAEGYQVDPKTRDLVKKSVIYFDGVKAVSGDEISVFLDGKPIIYTSPLELRVAPGAHDVVIVSEKTFAWKKRIFVPEETVLRFPEIQLFPNARPSRSEAKPFMSPTGESSRPSRSEAHVGAIFIPQVGSEDGVFFLHPRLHFGKFYSFENPDAPWVQNIPFGISALRLIPLTENFWFGVTKEGKLFSYDVLLRQHFPRADFPVLDARLADKTLYALDREGRIWKFDQESGAVAAPELFFRITFSATHFKRIEEVNGRMLFLFDRLAVVTQEDGAILFQESDIESATLDVDDFVYTKGKSLMRFDLRDKKLISTHPLKEPVRFMSRIGGTFHFLFVNSSLELFMCDEDFENCHSFGKIDEERIVVSEKRTRFFVFQNGALTLIDFEEPDVLPGFLQNLVSVLANTSQGT